VKTKYELPLALLAGAIAAFIFSGCSEIPPTRVEVPNVTINGYPVPMTLDTGAGGLLLTQSGANQAGLKYDSPPRAATLVINDMTATFSEPTRIQAGGREVTMPITVLPLPWYMRWPLAGDFTGLFGWDTIKDNILVFDSDRHVITVVDELPAETADWLKLKVHPDGNLVLETLLPDGKTGLILVDTGSPLGLGLPQAEFKKWRAAHPHASLVREFYGAMDKADAWSFDYYDYWADDINFFSLTFTHMPVHTEFSIESSFVGSIGMYALAQMDMVVDGKNGLAYLRTKKPDADHAQAISQEAPVHAPAIKGDWVFEGDIQLNPVHSFLDSANYKLGAKDNQGALADLEQVLKLEPDNEHARWLVAMVKLQERDFTGALPDWDRLLQLKPDNIDYAMNRGWVRLHLGDYDGSIADCSNVLKTHPDNKTAFLWRGLNEEIKGDFVAALADYDEVIKLKPDDSVYPRLYRQMVLLQLNQPAENFGQVVVTWKDGWGKTLGQYVVGGIQERALLKAAEDKKNPPVSGHQCEAYYFIGMMHLLKGDLAAARAAWQQAFATGELDYYEYLFAKAELARLDNPAPK